MWSMTFVREPNRSCYITVLKPKLIKEQLGIFLPSGEGGGEGGGSVDLAGGNGMCGGGLREVETRWRDCGVVEGKMDH